jgi:type I restriction enzyme, R subunit
MTFAPSPEKQKVIDHRGGHLQVIACAGAGKTEAISRHVAALIDEGVEERVDLLCHIAFNAPLRTWRERAERLCTEHKDFFDKYIGEARCILNELLEKYAEHGTAQFSIPEILEVSPISQHGNVMEIVGEFGGVEGFRAAVAELQNLLHAAA